MVKNVGPKRDIIGEFCESAKKYNVPFGVTTHDERFFDWNLPAFGADTDGFLKGVPYDGRLTKNNGADKWWEGVDPANLYGPPPDQRAPEWEEAWKKTWYLRMSDLLTKYDPDYGHEEVRFTTKGRRAVRVRAQSERRRDQTSVARIEIGV